MAKIYGNIEAKALMTFDKSFARSNGQPLDSTEIFYDIDAAEAYAKGDVAYVGQKIAVVAQDGDTTVVTHYSVEADGSLKELGAKVETDNRTIQNVDGVLGLANADDLSFENASTYNIVIKKNDVTGKAEVDYVIPSATTVEGLDTRLKVAEEAIDDLDELVGKPSGDTNSASGLFKTVENEIARSSTADQQFGTRLKNIESFVGSLTNPLQFLGATYFEPVGPVVTLMDGSTVGAKSGDVVLYGDKEYIYDGGSWTLFGDAGDLVTHSELQQAVESLEGNIKQANWNQENTDAFDYIIGRTHYEYTTYSDSPLDSTDEDKFTNFIEDKKGICQVIINNDKVKRNAVYSIDPLDSYVHIWTVNVDGTTYTCKYDSDESFELITEPAATWAFYPKAGTGVKKLDSKYVDAYTKEEVDAKFEEVGEDNIIEVIKANGETLEVIDKTVDIPLATAVAAGLVVSATPTKEANITEESSIYVHTDGKMYVDTLNVNRLVQTDYLILNGGNAALDFPIENN